MLQSRERFQPAGPKQPGNHSRIVRYGVWVTGFSMVFPQLIGSGFNIAYNAVHVERLLEPDQLATFFATVTTYNLTVYPLAAVLWFWMLWLLNRPFAKLLGGQPVGPKPLARARRMAINLPWWGASLGAAGWFFCVPVFLIALSQTETPLDTHVYKLLPISFAISGLIATTHAFFTLEMLSQRLLYPVFFVDCSPSETRGAYPLSLRSHGLLWALSAGVCPIGSLLLLMVAPHEVDVGTPWFGLSVGGIGIVFGLTTAGLVGRWVTEPVSELKRASQAVARGDLNAHVDLLRADDFGPLIDEFNEMVTGLREKQRVEETFGRHVGQQAAKLILERNPGLGGFEERVTVVFVDIRNFTARCERSTPEDVVEVLNLFLTEMVEIVEQHGGMVNKFLGDGFMAIFGLTGEGSDDEEAAAIAGCEMLNRLESLNGQLDRDRQPPLDIGIGIHSGPAIVGSIGSPRRMEFTVIGDTVNVASRVESLTKVVGRPLLVTSSTRSALPEHVECEELPPQRVKGQTEPLIVWHIKTQ